MAAHLTHSVPYVALSIMCLIAAGPAAAEDSITFDKDIKPLLRTYCFSCHGEKKQEARIRYDDIDGYRIEKQHLWTSVHEMISAGAMPPDDAPQPDKNEQHLLLRWIEQESNAARDALGSGSLRRLNRRELSAALQDLTGLKVNYRDALPGDGTVDGFDTVAEGLQDAADSVAAAMRVSRRAVDALSFLEAPAIEPIKVDFREVKDARRALDEYKDIGVSGKIRGDISADAGLYIEPKWVGERGALEIYVPVPADRRGVVRVKLVVAMSKLSDEIPNPNLWVEIGAKDVDFREVVATADQPQELIYDVQLEDLAVEGKGLKIALSNKVEVAYAVKGFENDNKPKADPPVAAGSGAFRPMFDRKKLPREEQPVPFISLQQLEIVPDLITSWPPPERHTRTMPIEDNLASASHLLNLWIEQAWRRPVDAKEQTRFVALYQKLRTQDMSFDDALRATFQSVLMSSSFRYLASPNDPNPLVAQHAIASRLSFMLWGAPPDEELRRLASDGKLRDAAILDEQVDRLLDDPRSDAFVRPFVTQWLVMEQPITIVMDEIEQQDFRFGRYLKESMREETFAYFAMLLSENRPIRELIDSDWTMMNESLAIHYGYDDVTGGVMRKVTLRTDDPRGGGLLGQAGIQSMLCWMGENWVIYRGAWTLRHLLNDPPPPPPLEVPELIPSDKENHGKTYRELLAQHQSDSKCSVCHQKMDPLGFAFQNFDLSGRWRDKEFSRYLRNELDGKIQWRGTGETRPVDARGQLPRGEEFATFDQCKNLLVENYQRDIVTGLLKNLTLYACGRKPDVNDLAEIRGITAGHSSKGFPMRDLLKAVVRSDAFLRQ